ncbi:MAG: type I methionyl aminopeptidase [bacterium]
MGKIKTTKEITAMKHGGAILAESLRAAVRAVKPGATLKEVDAAAEAKMRSLGAMPSFLNYTQVAHQAGFPSTVCVSVNEEVIHGPGNREIVLEEGDIVGLDIGAWFEGMATDMAVTVPCGKVSREKQLLMSRTYEALRVGLAQIKNGASVRAIGKAIQENLKPFGYGIVRDYVGHGVGNDLHEAPSIPNYDEPGAKGKLETGMTIAIEPMIIMGGDSRVDHLDDGWTVVSRDGTPSAHFEVTIVVTDDGYELLTPFVV